VGQLTSRPLVAGSENSTSSEMTTGSIGNTRGREVQIKKLMWWGSCRKRNYIVILLQKLLTNTYIMAHTPAYINTYTYTQYCYHGGLLC